MKTKRFKKFTALFLTLAMFMTFIQGFALTAGAILYSPIHIGNVELADGEYLASGATEATLAQPDGGYAHYKDGVLTLNGYNYSGEGYEYDSEYNLTAAIYSKADIEVVLVGESSLENTTDSGFGITSCPDGESELTIGGDGSLEIDAGNSVSAANVIVNGGTLNITASEVGISAKNVTISGGKLNITSGYFGIYGDTSVNISGADTNLLISASEGVVATFYPTLTVAENLAITSPDGSIEYLIGEGHDGRTIIDDENNVVTATFKAVSLTPVINSITFNSESSAYDAEINTFFVDDANPLIITITGENMLGSEMNFLVANRNIDGLYLEFTPAGNDAFACTIDVDFYRQIIDSFKTYGYDANIAYIGFYFSNENPNTEDLTELNVTERKPYSITLIANNGTEASDENSVMGGSEYTLANDIFTYGKCEIESWNTKADGSGDTYYVGDEITITEDITLYAQWVLPLYELDSFTDTDLEWSGNTSSPYTFKMKNGAVLYAGVAFPSQSNEEKTTITVDGDCEIKGSISFGEDDAKFRADLTITGDGTLKFYELVGTGTGDTFTVLTDVTILSDYMFIGASGGMDSSIVIKDATLTLHDLTLLQYLTMEGEAKLSITNGSMSFHSDPEINLGSKSEIYITGDGIDCVLYKEGGAHEAFDKLKKDNWLPDGYKFKDDGSYSLHDKNNNLETGSVTLKKRTKTIKTSSGGGGATYYSIKFDADGGSGVSNESVRLNYRLTEPQPPVKDGFEFGGWYTDENLTTAYDFDSKVTKSFTLYAKWNEANQDEDGNGTSGHNCYSLAFSDLDISKWYHYDTDYVIGKDIFKGMTSTVFAPDANITRAMFVTVLYRAEGEPATNRSIPFADIDMGAYYANAVVWAQQNGIVKGVSETEFAPNTDITREQIATIMFRYAQYKGMEAITLEENLHFDDVSEISEYAVSAMNWAVGKEIIKGYEDNTVRPLDCATRAEIAAIIHRFIENNK